jgi:hypothetical protein
VREFAVHRCKHITRRVGWSRYDDNHHGNVKDARLKSKSRRPRPFDPAQRDLTMNRPVGDSQIQMLRLQRVWTGGLVWRTTAMSPKRGE